MNRREKVLAGAVGLLVVVWFGSSQVSRFQAAVDDNRKELLEIEQQLSQARTARLRGQRAVTLLKRWQKQSLPTNPDIANSVYQDWLQSVLTGAGLKVTDIKASIGLRAPNDRFQEFNFKVEATGTIRQLVEFLTKFYRAGHLQRISRAVLTPAREGGGLSISLTVDALSMRDGTSVDKLSDATGTIELPPAEELHAAITQREIFSPYSARKAATASRSRSEGADKARISGMTLGAEGWRMSVRMLDSGRMLYFKAGDSISIGGFNGTINEIDGRRVVLDRDGSQLQVFLGQNLGQAQPVSPQGG